MNQIILATKAIHLEAKEAHFIIKKIPFKDKNSKEIILFQNPKIRFQMKIGILLVQATQVQTLFKASTRIHFQI